MTMNRFNPTTLKTFSTLHFQITRAVDYFNLLKNMVDLTFSRLALGQDIRNLILLSANLLSSSSFASFSKEKQSQITSH